MDNDSKDSEYLKWGMKVEDVRDNDAALVTMNMGKIIQEWRLCLSQEQALKQSELDTVSDSCSCGYRWFLALAMEERVSAL